MPLQKIISLFCIYLMDVQKYKLQAFLFPNLKALFDPFLLFQQTYIFAILGGLASFGIGNIAQSSEIAGAMTGLVGLSPLDTGILLSILIPAALAIDTVKAAPFAKFWKQVHPK